MKLIANPKIKTLLDVLREDKEHLRALEEIVTLLQSMAKREDRSDAAMLRMLRDIGVQMKRLHNITKYHALFTDLSKAPWWFSLRYLSALPNEIQDLKKEDSDFFKKIMEHIGRTERSLLIDDLAAIIKNFPTLTQPTECHILKPKILNPRINIEDISNEDITLLNYNYFDQTIRSFSDRAQLVNKLLSTQEECSVLENTNGAARLQGNEKLLKTMEEKVQKVLGYLQIRKRDIAQRDEKKKLLSARKGLLDKCFDVYTSPQDKKDSAVSFVKKISDIEKIALPLTSLKEEDFEEYLELLMKVIRSMNEFLKMDGDNLRLEGRFGGILQYATAYEKSIVEVELEEISENRKYEGFNMMLAMFAIDSMSAGIKKAAVAIGHLKDWGPSVFLEEVSCLGELGNNLPKDIRKMLSLDVFTSCRNIVWHFRKGKLEQLRYEDVLKQNDAIWYDMQRELNTLAKFLNEIKAKYKDVCMDFVQKYQKGSVRPEIQGPPIEIFLATKKFIKLCSYARLRNILDELSLQLGLFVKEMSQGFEMDNLPLWVHIQNIAELMGYLPRLEGELRFAGLAEDENGFFLEACEQFPEVKNVLDQFRKLGNIRRHVVLDESWKEEFIKLKGMVKDSDELLLEQFTKFKQTIELCMLEGLPKKLEAKEEEEFSVDELLKQCWDEPSQVQDELLKKKFK